MHMRVCLYYNNICTTICQNYLNNIQKKNKNKYLNLNQIASVLRAMCEQER